MGVNLFAAGLLAFFIGGTLVLLHWIDKDWVRNKEERARQEHIIADARVSYCLGKKVLQIGTCNYQGTCSVQWTDFSYGEMYMPVVGQDCK